MIPGIPYWRLSFFYFCYFAVLGALVPYWQLYLHDQGFVPKAIGILTAIMMGARIIAPNVWGWLADHTLQRMRIVRLGALLSALSFSLIYFGKGVWWLAFVITAYSFFWNAVLAQFEVVTFDYLKTRPHGYTRIRLWGSVGFILSVVVLGMVFDLIAVRWLPVYLLSSMTLVWLSSLRVHEAPQHATQEAEKETVLQILKKPEVICFFVVCFLMQISHGPYYTFFSLYMEQHEYSRAQIGRLWATGVVAEVVLFWFMYRLMPHWGIRFFMLLSLLLTSVRWALLALFPDVLPLVLFAQCLHAFSFGSFHASAIELVRRFFPARQAGRGQALYNSLSFGVGSAMGALFSGYLWDWSNRWTFLVASAVSLLGFIVAWFGVKDEYNVAS
jgi:PPP family 3-phenylpropionic acid transporter